MEKMLIKLNLIKQHNDLIKLKRQINQKSDENLELKNKCKNIFNMYDKKLSNIDEKMRHKIRVLEAENTDLKSQVENLQSELSYYKEQNECVPKFILKIFKKKK